MKLLTRVILFLKQLELLTKDEEHVLKSLEKSLQSQLLAVRKSLAESEGSKMPVEDEEQVAPMDEWEEKEERKEKKEEKGMKENKKEGKEKEEKKEKREVPRKKAEEEKRSASAVTVGEEVVSIVDSTEEREQEREQEMFLNPQVTNERMALGINAV
ncbi:hypothetical protein niasHT_005989 [Heterodera trifolii]|uniref:Uncharacterized protein n=1 Tax=Heterodera trifolii TaxID=157864 RepID=A0ABD2LWX0_9BILA